MKKAGSFILAIFVFIASINIVINQHFCNEDLESIAFFSKAQPCEHASADNALPPCHAKKVDQKKCCSENSVIIEAVDWLKISTSQVQHEYELAAIPSIDVNATHLIHTKLTKYSLRKIPKPPDEFETVYVVHQAFLL